MTEKTLDFDSPVEDFPDVWRANEPTIKVQIDVDKIVNKHVYLALEEILEDAATGLVLTDEGTAGLLVVVDDGDHFTQTFDLERVILALTADWDEPEKMQKMAASLRKCADHLDSLTKGK